MIAACDAAASELDAPRIAGWWRGASRLEDPFGSGINVSSTHLTQAFAVVSLALVPRGTLARHPGFFSARGPRRLTLVTCAGPYLPTHGGYQNLAVITARPVHAVGRRGAP